MGKKTAKKPAEVEEVIEELQEPSTPVEEEAKVEDDKVSEPAPEDTEVVGDTDNDTEITTEEVVDNPEEQKDQDTEIVEPEGTEIVEPEGTEIVEPEVTEGTEPEVTEGTEPEVTEGTKEGSTADGSIIIELLATKVGISKVAKPSVNLVPKELMSELHTEVATFDLLPGKVTKITIDHDKDYWINYYNQLALALNVNVSVLTDIGI